MSCSVWHFACFWVVFIISVRSTRGNDPFQGNFPTLKCQKARLITGCNGTLVGAYEQTNYSKSDKNINRADTFAFLYTRRNKECPEFLHRCGGRLPNNTNFGRCKRTIIIVGGYISAICDLAYFREFKDQFLFRDDYNVILIDWPWGFYPDIAGSFVNAKVVGKQIAFLMMNIMKQTGCSEKLFYIIGHSVGAHIAGYAGMHFTLFTGGKKIGRATGLDPANAAYSVAGDEDILDLSDAEFVDIISTNRGKCFPKAIGLYKPTGHANFLVNGGECQWSCIPNIFFSFLKGDLLRAIASFYFPLCSHFESTEYFKTSINPCGCEFIGFECDNEECAATKSNSCGEQGKLCHVMGMDAENCPHKNESTSYFVRTEPKCPYCDCNLFNSLGYRCDNLRTDLCFSPDVNPSTEICTDEM